MYDRATMPAAALAEPAGEAERAITCGQCAECGCPAFAGDGTYCTRRSCGRHWGSHEA